MCSPRWSPTSTPAASDYVTATIRETLRRRPVLSIAAPRRVMSEIEIGGTDLRPRLPPSCPTHTSSTTTPTSTPSPTPSGPSASSSRTPGTYTWIPFGGGRRRCLGASFAMLEMDIVLRAVLSRMEVRAARQRRPRGPSPPDDHRRARRGRESGLWRGPPRRRARPPQPRRSPRAPIAEISLIRSAVPISLAPPASVAAIRATLTRVRSAAVPLGPRLEVRRADQPLGERERIGVRRRPPGPDRAAGSSSRAAPRTSASPPTGPWPPTTTCGSEGLDPIEGRDPVPDRPGPHDRRDAVEEDVAGEDRSARPGATRSRRPSVWAGPTKVELDPAGRRRRARPNPRRRRPERAGRAP